MRSPVKFGLMILVASSMLFLQGCFTLAATGIGATALAIDDRRPIGIYVEDENIEVKARLRQVEHFKDAHLNFTSFNLQVLVTGEAPTEQMKKDISDMMARIPSVKTVTNEAVVAGNAAYTARSSDTITTASVKFRLIGNKAFAANHIKVVTEAGTVFLMGLVTRAEGDAAAESARTTSGVARVVKVFEYIEAPPKK